ncbi:glycosyltransferase family 4 protein [Patescibacteria group bacterium]|jgi:glycosyltransferase involved in cell wall biosynthesis|nr:glycosyltransferase family 4 protein [Patescibacteria group bacterium]
MKILVVTPACHFSRPGGAQEDMYATIALMQSLGHQVGLYTLHGPNQSEDRLETIRKTYGVPVFTYVPDLSDHGKWLKAVLKEPSLFDRAAYPFELMARAPGFRAELANWDVVFPFCSYAWPVLRAGKEVGIKTVFRSHNYEPTFFWEALETSQKLNPLNWMRRLAKRRAERLSVKYGDVTASTRLREMAWYEELKPKTIFELTLTYLPPLVRGPRPQKTEGPLDIFYLGASYNVSFHRRGVEVLLEEVVPKLKQVAPGAFRVHICGGKLPERLKALCDGTNAICEDYVPDLEAFLDKMDLGVFPVLTGRSIKGKVFGSICRAFPTVIPRIGASGYPLEDGKDVLYAETGDEYVDALLRLRDPALRATLSAGAAAVAEREFSHTAVRAQMERILNALN